MRQASKGKALQTQWNLAKVERSFSANYGQSYTRGMVCRTPKHFVWSAHAAGTEAKLSFCGIPGESGSLGPI